MPTQKPRIQVTLDSVSNGLLASMAEDYHTSKSAIAADLIREALELREDRALSDLSNRRLAEDDGTRLLHHDAWK